MYATLAENSVPSLAYGRATEFDLWGGAPMEVARKRRSRCSGSRRRCIQFSRTTSKRFAIRVVGRPSGLGGCDDAGAPPVAVVNETFARATVA